MADLASVFAPHSIAVIGASDRAGSVGRALFERLTTGGFAGDVIAVNPAHASVFGRTAYARIGDVPQRIDLAVVATPASTVPDVIRECARAGVDAAVVISAGFREIGAAGAALEAELRQTVAESGMRIVGPNCLGIIVPAIGLDATFSAARALPGSVGFVSQSGALCTAILDWASSRGIGFSCFVSAGSMVDVGWADYIRHLAGDARTQAILLYMESVGDDPAALAAALRDTAPRKPIVLMKSGRSEAAARAAASHTGALAGSDAVFDAVVRRCGALRVGSIEDLFDMADVLSKGNRPSGNRLMIVTNAGGPGVIAADAVVAGGAELAQPKAETIAALDRELPRHWSRANPIDVFGDADPSRYAKAVQAALADPGADAVLVIYAPQAVASAGDVADAIVNSARGRDKPLLSAWIGASHVTEGIARMEAAAIPAYPYPELAVSVFNYLWRYSENLRAVEETARRDDSRLDRKSAAAVVERAHMEGVMWLDATDCAALAKAYDLPLLPCVVARTEEETVVAARSLGYPVAIKVVSSSVVHKTEVGGVRLDVMGDAAARQAFGTIRAAVTARAGAQAFEGASVQRHVDTSGGIELLLGSVVDPQFGPVIAFGLGGVLVEVLRDRAIGLPPLNAASAHRLMRETLAYRALGPIRGRKPVDVSALAQIIERFSHLAADMRDIVEIECNPLFASADRIVALDMRVRIRGASAPVVPAVMRGV